MSNSKGPNRLKAFLVGGTLTIAAVVITDRVSAAVENWDGAGLVFVALALGQLSAVAVSVYRLVGGATWIAASSMFVAVPFGVLTDVAFDSMYYGRDRNLFPFEILMFWIAALVPALLASL